MAEGEGQGRSRDPPTPPKKWLCSYILCPPTRASDLEAQIPLGTQFVTQINFSPNFNSLSSSSSTMAISILISSSSLQPWRSQSWSRPRLQPWSHCLVLVFVFNQRGGRSGYEVRGGCSRSAERGDGRRGRRESRLSQGEKARAYRKERGGGSKSEVRGPCLLKKRGFCGFYGEFCFLLDIWWE